MNSEEFWKEWEAFRQEYVERHNARYGAECVSLFQTYILTKPTDKGKKQLLSTQNTRDEREFIVLSYKIFTEEKEKK